MNRAEAVTHAIDLEAKRAAASAGAVAARAEADHLDDGAGSSLLDGEPGAAGELVARIAALRAEADMQDRVAAEAERRRDVARSDALRAEADELQPEVDVAREALEQHRTKVEKAVAVVERVSGMKVRLRAEVDDWQARNPGGSAIGKVFRAPLEFRLQQDVSQLERTQEVLRAAADDPSEVRGKFQGLSYSDLPDSLREGGLLTLPGFYAPAPPRDWQEEFDEALGIARDLTDRVSSMERKRAAGETFQSMIYDDPLPGLQRQRDRALSAAHTLKAQAANKGVAVIGSVPVPDQEAMHQ